MRSDLEVCDYVVVSWSRTRARVVRNLGEVLGTQEVLPVLHQWRQLKRLLREMGDVRFGVEDVAAREFFVQLAIVSAFSLSKVYLNRWSNYFLLETIAEHSISGLRALHPMDSMRIPIIQYLLQSQLVNMLWFILVIRFDLCPNLDHICEPLLWR